MLAGSWKSANGSCTAVLNEFANIEISFAGGSLSRGFGITQLGPVLGIIGTASSNAIGMMGMAGMMGMLGMQRHEGESLRLGLDGAVLKSGNEEFFRVDCVWYGEEKIHIELTDLRNRQKWHHVLLQDAACAVHNNSVSSSDLNTFTCECGYHGLARKFCPECGKAIVKKAFEKKELIFAISMSMSTNPPRSDGAKVYAYSEKELILERFNEQRLISIDVLETAYEIIRKNKLDDTDYKDPLGGAIMGGTANVGFKNGEEWINASMYDKGNAALNAYYQLKGLFQNA